MLFICILNIYFYFKLHNFIDYKGNLEKIKVNKNGEIIKNSDTPKKLTKSISNADLEVINRGSIFDNSVPETDHQVAKSDALKKTPRITAQQVINRKIIKIISTNSNKDDVINFIILFY